MQQTYDPSSRLTVHKLLGIGPLFHEIVCGLKVGRDGPFAKPQGRVPDRSGILNLLEVWTTQVLAHISFESK